MNAIVPISRTAPAPSAIMRPQSVAELDIFAQRAARSGMVPAAYAGKPDAIFIAVQMGSELGLAPMQALQNIAVINGRPAVWGDAMPGLCRQSPICDDIEEWFEGDGTTLAAHCKATRAGKKPITQCFSVDDAKKAGLWSKAGPWTQYPRRMLQMRARGFALRDAFPDVLRGLISAEEAQDIPRDNFAGTTINAEPVTEQPTPQKRTIRNFIDELRTELDAATDAETVDAIIARPDVQKAEETFTNGARTELNAIIKAALDRTAPVNDDAMSGEAA